MDNDNNHSVRGSKGPELFFGKKTMKRSRAEAGILLSIWSCIWLVLACGSIAYIQAGSQTPIKIQKEAAMTKHASGTFEVKLKPLPDDFSDNSIPGRMSIDKQFHGDLEGTSKGQMLAARTKVNDSAGYVAIELVNGTLNGHKGTFVLQHSGTMTRGEQQLSITVVPDSGTDQFEGIAGRMTIKIEDGKHFYEFDYTLPKAR